MKSKVISAKSKAKSKIPAGDIYSFDFALMTFDYYEIDRIERFNPKKSSTPHTSVSALVHTNPSFQFQQDSSPDQSAICWDGR